MENGWNSLRLKKKSIFVFRAKLEGQKDRDTSVCEPQEDKDVKECPIR